MKEFSIMTAMTLTLAASVAVAAEHPPLSTPGVREGDVSREGHVPPQGSAKEVAEDVSDGPAVDTPDERSVCCESETGNAKCCCEIGQRCVSAFNTCYCESA